MVFKKEGAQARRGFTLIELLVVIAIIGILAAIVYVNFSDARKQARDRTRMAQVEQMRVALELYKDQYGRYPARGCGAPANRWVGPTCANAWCVQCEEYIVGHAPGINFVPDFIDELPQDPYWETTSGYYYALNVTNTAYKFSAYQAAESLRLDSRAHPLSRYPVMCVGSNFDSGFTFNRTTYSAYSLGAQCW